MVLTWDVKPDILLTIPKSTRGKIGADVSSASIDVNFVNIEFLQLLQIIESCNSACDMVLNVVG